MNRAEHRPFVATMLVVAFCGVAVSGVAAPDEKKKPTATPTPRSEGGKSLNEVAKDTQLKGGEEGKSIVISNENLAEYAEKGRLTGESNAGASAGRRSIRPDGTDVRVADTSAPAGQVNERKRFWQSEYQKQLNLVATMRNQISLLDTEIPGLWRDFYSRDDPFYRDGVIKPKLDAALERRQSLEEDLAEAEPRLNQIKEDARRDGAEPGWFRGMKMPTPIPPTPTPGLIEY